MKGAEREREREVKNRQKELEIFPIKTLLIYIMMNRRKKVPKEIRMRK